MKSGNLPIFITISNIRPTIYTIRTSIRIWLNKEAKYTEKAYLIKGLNKRLKNKNKSNTCKSNMKVNNSFNIGLGDRLLKVIII